MPRKLPQPHWLQSSAVAAAAVMLLIAGCQQKMADQPSYKPLQPCTYFEDGRSARPAVVGTVARGHLHVDPSFYTGRIKSPQPDYASGLNAIGTNSNVIGANSTSAATPPPPPRAPEDTVGGFVENGRFVESIPIPVNESVLNHGYNRYMIYCVPCHDSLGTGHGKIIERGYTAPPSFQIDRLRSASVGRLFAVATEGYGSMPSYAAQIPPEDRWAIVAYIKALQLSQHFPADELTPAMRSALADARNAVSQHEPSGKEDGR